MDTKKKPRFFPFNAEQTINILSEFGPLVTMFVINAMFGINAGTWALVITTVIAIAVMYYMFHRPPVFPLIASSVTIFFGALTLITHDAMWVQIKVTIFNSLLAVIFYVGVLRKRYFFEFVFGKTFHYSETGWHLLTRNVALFFLITAIANEAVRLGFETTQIPCPDAWSWLVRKEIIGGLEIWMIFKLFVVMPLTTLYLVWQVRLLQQYRLPEPVKARS